MSAGSSLLFQVERVHGSPGQILRLVGGEAVVFELSPVEELG